MSEPKRLAVKLQPVAERKVIQGHPWVFSDSILKISSGGNCGDVAIIFKQRTNKAMAVGLYDPDAPIRIKIIHHNGAQNINTDFWHMKISNALTLRRPLLENKTNAYRLIFGENDGFPGLIVDIYNVVGVIKVYSGVWFPYLKIIARLIAEITGVTAIVLRLSRIMQKVTNDFKEGDIIYGHLEDPEVVFQEYGVHFQTNVIYGHKTGFFLDHRENRHRIGQMASGKTILDVFSYAGGFSIHALVGGAKEVTSLDVSPQALDLAQKNAALNEHSGKHTIIIGDAFEHLKKLVQQGQLYDIVIIDPPSFAKDKSEIYGAKKKYGELAILGAKLIKKNGILLLASCSSRISRQDLMAVHHEVFNRMKIKYKIIDVTEHDIDHPIKFPEGAYLKSIYYCIG
ncbi:MAG: class I SAM-dependent methyltransferase [Saprospiraceae bacterium]|nr:MAG: rRNA (guanine-N(2)-)-methyltransferase [Bacteroidetes bacterium OLB9]MCO6464474.1 class I SAM-dependent methyltransferase [Saprospiraceae bacterium]